MRQTLLSIFFICALISCSNDSDKLDTYKGIGTIENVDSAFIIHYYDYTFIFDKNVSTLSTGCRVCFQCVAKQKISSDSLIYKAKLIELSDDITAPLIFCNSTSDYITKRNSYCVPTDMHITRDYRRDDFFNITCYYPTRDNNQESTQLVINNDEQLIGNDTIIIWLRHYQNRTDSLRYFSYDTISVPLNILINPDCERTYICLKHFSIDNDTIINNFTYSWK